MQRQISQRLIRFLTSSLILSFALGLTTHCTPGGVGDPCIPEDEYRTNFSGFGASEVSVESRSFQCATRICLVDHFQGRVSCPYGQTEEDLALRSHDPRRCRVPGTDGLEPEEAVQVSVDPWLTRRAPKDVVYCSCRCDGPDAGADYCECPSGFACERLVPDLGSLGSGNLAGSYCVKERPVESHFATEDCRQNSDHGVCPEPAFVNP